MTSRSPKSKATRSSTFTVSLILGLLLIPLSAVAAAAVISNGEDPGSGADEVVAVATEVPETTVTTTEAETVETIFVTEAPTFSREDLEAACGDQGWELVESEAEGTIGELEQAALDSLRQICAEEGLELPGPPAPPAIVRTVTVVDPSPAETTTTTMDDESDSLVGHDDEVDHDEDEDHEDDDDHEKKTKKTKRTKKTSTKRTRRTRTTTDAERPDLNRRGHSRHGDRSHRTGGDVRSLTERGRDL